MAFEYTHVSRDNFDKFLRNRKEEDLGDLITGLEQDMEYSKSERQQLIDRAYERWVELTNERETAEKIEKERADRRQRSIDIRERNRNRDVAEYTNEELASAYQTIRDNLDAMERRINSQDISDDEYVDRYDKMSQRFDRVSAEMKKRNLNPEQEKKNDSMLKEYTSRVRHMDYTEYLAEEEKLQSLIDDANKYLNSGNVRTSRKYEVERNLKNNQEMMKILQGRRLRVIPTSQLLSEREALVNELHDIDDRLKNINGLTNKAAQNSISRYEKRRAEIQEKLGKYNKQIKDPKRPGNSIKEEPKVVKPVEPKIKPENKPVEPVKVEPVKAEPVKVEPVKAEPVKVEPVKAEPVKVEPVKVEPVKAEPVKVEPDKVEPVKVEPVKVEPDKVEPVKVEPENGPKVLNIEPVDENNTKGDDEAKKAPPKKNVLKRIGAALLAGLTAVSVGIGTLWSRLHKDKQEKLPPAMEDVLKDDNLKESDIKYTSYLDEMENNKENNKDEEKDVTKNNSSMKDKYRVTDDETKKVKRENEIARENKAMKEFELGQTLKLPKDMQFQETVFGGRTGRIGEKYSPQDGIYVINRVAEVSNDSVSNVYGLEGKIQRHDKDSEMFVHIAFVPGARTEKEAKEILEGQKEENRKEKDRGWVKLGDLHKAMEKMNKEQQQNQEMTKE